MGEGDQVREDQAGVRQGFYFRCLAAMRSSQSRPPDEQISFDALPGGQRQANERLD